MVHVRALPHRPVMQHEAMPVLRDARRNARPDRGSGPALRDPPGVGPEDREHPLLLRNLPALQQAAVDRVNLLLRRVQEMPDLPDALRFRPERKASTPGAGSAAGTAPDTPARSCRHDGTGA